MRRALEHTVAEMAGGAGFRLYLHAELARRCAANPRYSLRSFARSLGLDHSTLSQIIRGRRRLTEAMIARLGRRLGLQAGEIGRFIALEASAATRGSASARGVRQLANDVATMLADADHRAILNLMSMEEFRPDSRWIARVLNRSVDEVNVLITRLLRLGVVEMVEPVRWISHADLSADDEDAFTRYIASRLAERVRGLASVGAAEMRVSYVLPPAGLRQLLEVLGRPEDQALATVRTMNAGEDGVRYRVEITIRPETDGFQSPEEMHNGTTGNAMADDRQES